MKAITIIIDALFGEVKDQKTEEKGLFLSTSYYPEFGRVKYVY